MNLLLDTHALIWWWLNAAQLPAASREMIDNPETKVFVSIASLWEIAIKAGLGNLDLDDRLWDDIRSGAALATFEELPISRRQAIEAGMLQRLHGDPFDRMLIAQARLEGLTLVSNEKLFDNYGVSRLWD